MFVALEGIDGSGTTTQQQRLAAELTARGHRVWQTCQPSVGELGSQVRKWLQPDHEVCPRALALLFAADRLEHLRHDIEPALDRGEVVLCDRYVLSSWVYQALECPPDWVETINRFARWPDATFVLDLPADVALARVRARPGSRERFETQPTLAQLAAGYRAALGRDLPGLIRVDASAPVESVTDVLSDACTHLGL